MPSLMATHWMGQKSGPIFRHFWTKVHWIKYACAGVSVVIDDLLLRSRDIWDQVAKFSQTVQKFWRFGPANFGGRGHPNFWPNFINLDHHWTCGKVWWRSAKRPQRLGGKKERKKDLNYSSNTEWPAASTAGGRP